MTLGWAAAGGLGTLLGHREEVSGGPQQGCPERTLQEMQPRPEVLSAVGKGGRPISSLCPPPNLLPVPLWGPAELGTGQPVGSGAREMQFAEEEAEVRRLKRRWGANQLQGVLGTQSDWRCTSFLSGAPRQAGASFFQAGMWVRCHYIC